MATIKIEKSELEAKKQEKIDLIRSIEEYRRVLGIRKNRIANLNDKVLDLEISIDNLLMSAERDQYALKVYQHRLNKIPNWVKKIYKA